MGGGESIPSIQSVQERTDSKPVIGARVCDCDMYVHTRAHARAQLPVSPDVAPKGREQPLEQPFCSSHRGRRGKGGGGRGSRWWWWGEEDVGGGEEEEGRGGAGLVGGGLPEHEGEAGEAWGCFFSKAKG